MKSNKILSKNYIAMLCTAVAISMMLTACGGSSGTDTSSVQTDAYNGMLVDSMSLDSDYGVYEKSAGSSSESYNEGSSQSEETVTPIIDNRKLIRTVDIETETEQYDDVMNTVESRVAVLGGYIEYQYQYNGAGYTYNPYVYDDSYSFNSDENRNANLTIRIPSDRLDEFIGKVDEISNILNKEERTEDVTLKYVDLESHKKSLETERDRLMELLDRADTVEDLITIESRLSDVRYELESMESQIRTLQNQVSYSTVNLTIREVKRLTPVVQDETIFGRIKQGLSDTFYDIRIGAGNFFVWFIVNLPYIVLWGVIITVLFIVTRPLRRMMRRRKHEKRQKQSPYVGTNPVQVHPPVMIQMPDESRQSENIAGSISDGEQNDTAKKDQTLL